MSSSVFFRFKSQKEPTRVTFDGTGISVFELKREIISLSNLGDGTDFELIITSVDQNEEYDDDTSIIPRSTTVIAKRLPAAKPGRGGAARYVSGKMPQSAKNTHRQETHKPAVSGPDPSQTTAHLNGAQTEEERIQAMFKNSADQWAQDQQAMASATPVLRGGQPRGKATNAPDHPPPSGYICYRCGEKGHWIQACPTNNDPTFDGRPRVKRTTGIPKSFLKTVEKPSTQANDGTIDDTKQPSGIMVNAEGEWVVAEPDKATWDRFQAKAQVSAAAEKAAAQGSRDLQEKGLECSIDKRLFVKPTKTPCCHKTFCHECITNALVENDLKCPECSTEDVPIDNLLPDKEMEEKVQKYLDELSSLKEDSNALDVPQAESELTHDNKQVKKEPSPDQISKSDKSRKRPAEAELVNERRPIGPPSEPSATASPRTKAAIATTTAASRPEAAVDVMAPTERPHSNPNRQTSTMPTASFSNGDMSSGVLNPLAFSNVSGFMGLPTDLNNMNMNMNMNLNPNGMNFGINNPMMSMMGGAGSFMNNNGNINHNEWNNPNNMNNNLWAAGGGGFGQQGMGMGMGMGMGLGMGMGMGMPNGMANGMPNGMMNGMMNNGIYGQPNMFNAMGNGQLATNGLTGSTPSPGIFANQQRTSFASPSGTDEDSAYFRKPVNPHRHQGRRNLNRPADYREI